MTPLQQFPLQPTAGFSPPPASVAGVGMSEAHALSPRTAPGPGSELGAQRPQQALCPGQAWHQGSGDRKGRSEGQAGGLGSQQAQLGPGHAGRHAQGWHSVVSEEPSSQI